MTPGLSDVAIRDRFPRSADYDQTWVVDHSMGPNALWLTEFLVESLTLEPGMRVLDHGCGMGMTSIFLAREFGVEVWANDLWISAEDNTRRFSDVGLVDQIHAVHADARALPYETDFFDAIVSMDAYHYFGTDDMYLGYLSQFLKTGGQLGIVCPGLMSEFELDPPEHLHAGWHWQFASFHSAAWWSRHWQRSGKVEVSCADTLAEGWRFWAHWDRVYESAKGTSGDADTVERDAGRHLTFVRVVARKRDAPRWG
ncbi:MAG: methyltransferase domain-containing protein [Pseudomonadota bacterium]